MLAGKIVLSTYAAGIGGSGIYSAYLAGKDFTLQKKYEQENKPDIIEPQISEFFRYSGRCGTGFIFGVFCGFVWPITLACKTISYFERNM